MDFIPCFGIYFLLALIPAGIAQEKGRSFLGWYVAGLLVLPIAIVAALIVDRGDRVPELETVRLHRRLCPVCAERVKREAKICIYCGDVLAPDESALGLMTPDERELLTDAQRFFIESAGYFLAADDAAAGMKLLRQRNTEAVAELFLERGEFLD